MCFYQGDCDWYASITEQSDSLATTQKKCDECGRTIKIGDPVHHVFMHETCQACENGDCDCHVRFDGDDHECQCKEPIFGETFDYDRCQDCSDFLDVVEKAELEAGCRQSESRPPYTSMIEDIGRPNGDRDDAKRYFKKAAKIHPNLVESGYLGWLWRKMF